MNDMNDFDSLVNVYLQSVGLIDREAIDLVLNHLVDNTHLLPGESGFYPRAPPPTPRVDSRIDSRTDNVIYVRFR